MAHDDSGPLTPLDSDVIAAAIVVVRAERVMLDADLARFYGVTTKNLNKAVARNPGRFPADIMFQLTRAEYEALRFQIGTSKPGRGGRRYVPYAFTEHGALMLSSVLSSQRAEQVGLFIVRAFIRLRQLLINDLETAKRLVELEAKVWKHDRVLQQLRDAARHFIQEQAKIKAQIAKRVDAPKKRTPGFRHED